MLGAMRRPGWYRLDFEPHTNFLQIDLRSDGHGVTARVETSCLGLSTQRDTACPGAAWRSIGACLIHPSIAIECAAHAEMAGAGP